MKSSLPKSVYQSILILTITIIALTFSSCTAQPDDELKEAFKTPPETSKPGVYWYFMDGNLNKKEMTKDLESMKEVGINNLIFLEVNIGVPRGAVHFMSEEWQNLYVHAVREAERLGIRILLGAGPGWCGSGGPWVKPEESMKHLVYSETQVKGNQEIDMHLPLPEQRSTNWHKMKDDYYEDVAVYAIPDSIKPVIEGITEKALYRKDPYTIRPHIDTYIPAPANYAKDTLPVLRQEDIINLAEYLQPDGKLVWEAPKGNWTIIRMGKRVTGASSRPAPVPAIGLETNKMDSTHFKNHLSNYTDILLEKVGERKAGIGWTGFHMDSWESGSQNWTEGIVEQFKARRGYDPEPYFLAYTGRAIKSIETTERFLWDLRQTCKELILENHAEFAKRYAHRNGLELTIEPYDMNPVGDLDLGSVADVIMAEFWSKRYGHDSHYAVFEATSVSHINGRNIVGAEVFTSRDKWREYPWSMKDQSDWALCLGVNRFVYHTFAHKPLGDQYRPGMQMGPYGVHWDRGQTWWPMVGTYHEYISRASHIMQQGQYVSDILYLVPEGSPMIFTPPADAIKPSRKLNVNANRVHGTIPDKKEHGFDGCSPTMLESAIVENGKIVFPGASTYEVLVLPNFETMTPQFLEKITSLVADGATVIGLPPLKSPSLTDYPNCDNTIQSMANKLWGGTEIPDNIEERTYEKGRIFWGGDLHHNITDTTLYPTYASTLKILAQLKVEPDFISDRNNIRFGHRRTETKDLYLVANRTEETQSTKCTFRASGAPELWNSVDGSTKKITQYKTTNGITSIDLKFVPYGSYFVVFNRNKAVENEEVNESPNFETYSKVQTLEGAWEVAFDSKWGGPEQITFDELQDWTDHEERGIKYYSGIATYNKSFTIDQLEDGKYFLDLGVVSDIARVKLNGKDIGVVWCAPWHIEISDALQQGENKLEIEVANRWVNRLIGDSQEPDANVRTVKFENGLLEGKEYTTGRYTFTTNRKISKEMTPSGLIGPVTIQKTK
jgi:hypothetical protein